MTHDINLHDPHRSHAARRRGELIGPVGQIVFGLYLILLALGLGAFMIWAWGFDGKTWGGKIDSDAEFIALVMGAGAIGAYVHVASSFSTFVGDRRLKSSWLWWYILRPFIGAALALIVYFAVRGGLLVPTINVGETLSPFGIAAVSGLVGMFSKQAADKLNELFTDLFRTARGTGDDARGDKLPVTEESHA